MWMMDLALSNFTNVLEVVWNICYSNKRKPLLLRFLFLKCKFQEKNKVELFFLKGVSGYSWILCTARWLSDFKVIVSHLGYARSLKIYHPCTSSKNLCKSILVISKMNLRQEIQHEKVKVWTDCGEPLNKLNLLNTLK